jgi:hypothetical protein
VPEEVSYRSYRVRGVWPRRQLLLDLPELVPGVQDKIAWPYGLWDEGYDGCIDKLRGALVADLGARRVPGGASVRLGATHVFPVDLQR